MKITRCFIENNNEIDDYDKDVFEDLTENLFADIQIIITDAYTNPDKCLDSIIKSDEIYISSAFIGESGRLLKSMCKSVIDLNIKNKIVINLRRSSDIHSFIDEKEQKAMNENGIIFLFYDTYDDYFSNL